MGRLPPGEERAELKFDYKDPDQARVFPPNEKEQLDNEYRALLVELMKNRNILKHLFGNGLDADLVNLVFVEGKSLEEANLTLKYGPIEYATERYKEVLQRIKVYLRLKTEPSFLTESGLSPLEQSIVQEVILNGVSLTSWVKKTSEDRPQNRKLAKLSNAGDFLSNGMNKLMELVN